MTANDTGSPTALGEHRPAPVQRGHPPAPARRCSAPMPDDGRHVVRGVGAVAAARRRASATSRLERPVRSEPVGGLRASGRRTVDGAARRPGYRYVVTGAGGDAHREVRSGGGRRHFEPPSTASVIADLAYDWGDGDWMARPRAARPARRTRRSRSTRCTSVRGAAPSSPGAAGRATTSSPTRSPSTPWPTASPTSSCCRSWSTRSTDRGATRRPGTSPRPRATARRTDLMQMIDRLHQRGVGVHPRLGAVALPDGRPRAGPVRRHPPLRARRPAPGLPPRLDVGDLQLRPRRGAVVPDLQRDLAGSSATTSTGCGSTPWRRCSTSTTPATPGEWIPNQLRRPREPRGDRLPAPAQRRRSPTSTPTRRRSPRSRRRGRRSPGRSADGGLGLHVQVGHGLDARHVAVPAPRPGAPPVPPRRDHVPQRVRVHRALRAAAVARRGRARQGVAARQDAGRRLAAVRQRCGCSTG